MRILIIEDEAQAARRLAYLIADLDRTMVVAGQADSVKRSVAWLKSNPAPDLIFMDIQLGDGLSFEIFEKVDVTSPIIFTTAYDEYALKAFKVNSIDYILKPVDKADLEAALLKLKNLAGSHQPSTSIIENIGKVVQQLTKKFKERFVIKVGEHLRTIEVSDILYLYSQEKTTFCVTQDGRNHILDFTLEQVADLVNPGEFFRINRKYLIHSRSIKDIISHSNSRLKLVLKTSLDTDIVVARERVQAFKAWLDQ
jgi:DNA-binding LytR/AlgR family response regulator